MGLLPHGSLEMPCLELHLPASCVLEERVADDPSAALAVLPGLLKSLSERQTFVHGLLALQ